MNFSAVSVSSAISVDGVMVTSAEDGLMFKEDPREFQYFYRHLFSTINKIDFRFVFITGVSSYKQGDIFGDPNLLIDISLDPRYATCCGYTKEELEHNFAPELDHAQQQNFIKMLLNIINTRALLILAYTCSCY